MAFTSVTRSVSEGDVAIHSIDGERRCGSLQRSVLGPPPSFVVFEGVSPTSPSLTLRVTEMLLSDALLLRTKWIIWERIIHNLGGA